MRLFTIVLTVSLTLAGCSPATGGSSNGAVTPSGNVQSVSEVGLPPSMTVEQRFELVYDSTLEDTFVQTVGVHARPLTLFYESGLFFLVLNYAPHAYFPLQGGSDLRMAVSTDGEEWALSDQPIFNTTDGQDFTYWPYSMLRLPDGSYALYAGARAESIETIQTWATQYTILRATASNPMEEWTLLTEPVLLPGDPYSWDRSVVWSPYVFMEDNGFRMYYWGQPGTDFNSDNGVGIALSEDGIVWEKSLPDGGNLSPAESNLLLSRSQDAWVEIILLHVWQTVDGWQLMYYLRDRRDSGLPHLAFSPDGVEWTPLEGDIQLPEATTPDDIVYASVVYAQDHYWMMYCVGIDNTYCFLARTE